MTACEKRPSEPVLQPPLQDRAAQNSGETSAVSGSYPSDYSDYSQADYDLDQGPQS